MTQHIAYDVSKKTWTKDIKIQDDVTFFQMGFSQNILDGLIIAGVQRPSPLQLEVILFSRCGYDIIIRTESRVGKTLVFGIIALEMLDIQISSPQVLIIAPTREIAIQISHVIKVIGSKTEGLNIEHFVRGMPIEEDKKKLSKCHIAIGASDHVEHLIKNKLFNVSTIRLFVLDEAVKLLEIDHLTTTKYEKYKKSINYIVSKLPSNKQVIATTSYDKDLETFLRSHMFYLALVSLNTPIFIHIKQFVAVVSIHPNTMKQIQIKVDELVKIFTKISFERCLVFTNCQSRAQLVSNKINSMGFSSLHISENQNMTNRLETTEKLRNFKCRILVTTDLTARSIDAKNINMVVNFDVPTDPVTYLRRIGRARCVFKGISITIISENELSSFRELLTLVGGPNFYLFKLNYAKDVWASKAQKLFERVYSKSKKSRTEFSDIDKATLESENDAIPICKLSPQVNDISKNNIANSSAIKHSECESVAFKNIAANDTLPLENTGITKHTKSKNGLSKHVASNGTSLLEDNILDITAVKDNICKDILPKDTTINDTSSPKSDIASIITMAYEKHKSVLKDRKCHGVVYNNICLKSKRTNLEKKKKISLLFEHYGQGKIQEKANFRQSIDVSEECKRISTTTDSSELRNIYNTMTRDYMNNLMKELNENLFKADFLNIQDYKLSNADIEDISEYIKFLLSIKISEEKGNENMKDNEKVFHDIDSAKDSIAMYNDGSMYSDDLMYSDGLMYSDDSMYSDDDSIYSDSYSNSSDSSIDGYKIYSENSDEREWYRPTMLCPFYYLSDKNPIKALNYYLLEYSMKIKTNNDTYMSQYDSVYFWSQVSRLISNWEELLNLEIDLSDNIIKSMTDSIHKLVYEEYYSALKIFLCIQKRAFLSIFFQPRYLEPHNSDNNSSDMYKEIEDFKSRYIKKRGQKICFKKDFKYFPYPTNIEEYMPNLKISSSEIEDYRKALQYLKTYGNPNKKLLEIIDHIAFLSETEHHNLFQKIKDEKLSFSDMKAFLIEEATKRDLENNKLTEYLQESEKSIFLEKGELTEPLQTFEKSVLLKHQQDDKTTHQKQGKTDVSRINIINNTNLKTKEMQEACSNEVTGVNQNKNVEIENTKCNIPTKFLSSKDVYSKHVYAELDLIMSELDFEGPVRIKRTKNCTFVYLEEGKNTQTEHIPIQRNNIACSGTNLKIKKMQEACSNEVTVVNQNKHVEIESTKCNIGDCIPTNTVSNINQIEVLVNKENSNVSEKSFQIHKKKNEEDDENSISSESSFHTPEDMYSSAELIFDVLSKEQKMKSMINSKHNKENTYTEKERNINPTEQQAGLSNQINFSCQTRSEYIPADSCLPPTHKIHGLDRDRTNDTSLHETEIDMFLLDLRRQTDQLHLQIYKKQMVENWI